MYVPVTSRRLIKKHTKYSRRKCKELRSIVASSIDRGLHKDGRGQISWHPEDQPNPVVAEIVRVGTKWYLVGVYDSRLYHFEYEGEDITDCVMRVANKILKQITWYTGSLLSMASFVYTAYAHLYTSGTPITDEKLGFDALLMWGEGNGG